MLLRVFHFAAFALLVCFSASADQPPGYYQSAEGKTGAVLRQALHTIIKGHNVILYDSASNFDSVDALKVLDEDPANTNNVIASRSRILWPTTVD